MMDGTEYEARRFHVLHGGKGMRLNIFLSEETFEYYLIFYKAVFTLPYSRDVQQFMERNNPFQVQYGFKPQDPICLYHKVQQMDRQWRQSRMLDKLHVRGLFFQFVHDLLRQLNQQGLPAIRTDLVTLAVRFIQEHYAEPLTLDKLAEVFDCSAGHLSKLFKQELANSPIHFVTEVRMERAKELLLLTDSTLQEIAIGVGYVDKYHFSRIFKKHTGLSPILFRVKDRQNFTDEKESSRMRRISIVQRTTRRYIGNDNDYQYIGEGDLPMYRNSKPSLAAVMLLCLTLLLSACQTGGNTTSNANERSPYSDPSPAQNETSPAGDGNETAATRVFNHKYGETVIPKQPNRIVTAFHLGQLMALGVRPLGSSTYILQNPVLDTEGMEDLGVPLNLEKISGLDPDLIILVDAYVDMSGGYDAFSKIAPTIVIEPYYDPVKDIALMGDILGKEDEAKLWIEEFEKKIAGAKQQVQDAIDVNETYTIASFYEKSPRVYRDENMGGNILYKYLGLKPQQKVLSDLINSGQKPPYAEVSAEVISDFVGDNLFVAVNEENKAAFESFKNTGIWRNMEAVKNNKVYTIDYDLFLESDPIAVTKQVEILTKILIDKNK
ncbi:hypothetical protein GCM10010911_63960 [Paenibacillus nasutitermitis]|uniref:Iron complex transport system substrate-binding protein n=2 Tax=Paenibacillus nasutitermitis TaxID=1652958 RepID=A0A916ZHI5_9BACL|nr:hypothetical protein GCM10010911_63960 [Paenibacillus nasutitermitis]